MQNYSDVVGGKPLMLTYKQHWDKGYTCIQGLCGGVKQHKYTRFGASTGCSELVYPLWLWGKVSVYAKSSQNRNWF